MPARLVESQGWGARDCIVVGNVVLIWRRGKGWGPNLEYASSVSLGIVAATFLWGDNPPVQTIV